MDDRTYIEAAVPEPFTVLGLRLRPLSIGHLILLHKLESPFVQEAALCVSVGDLALACLICSKTFGEGIALLDNPKLAQGLLKWAQRSTNQYGWRRLCPWLYKPIDIKSKLDLFSEYLRYHMEMPCYSVEDGRSRSVNCPAWQVVRMALLSKTNLTEEEILDRPYRLCMSDFLTLRAMDGQLQLEDGSQLERARELANQFADRINQQRSRGNGG